MNSEYNSHSKKNHDNRNTLKGITDHSTVLEGFVRQVVPNATGTLSVCVLIFEGKLLIVYKTLIFWNSLRSFTCTDAAY
jgi:hypothetical protein